MTVVVAVRDGTRVCMACDSQATNNGSKLALARQSAKIIRRDGMLFGCGSLAVMDVIRFAGPEPGPHAELHDWCAVIFVPWLRAWLTERALMDKDDRGGSIFPCHVLVARGAELVHVDASTGCFVPERPFQATGGAFMEALGAMWQASRDADGQELMHDRKSANAAVAEYIARSGVEAAIALDSGCGPPVVVEWTDSPSA